MSEKVSTIFVSLQINNKTYDVNIPEDEPLLWVLRDDLGLTGTKHGCHEGICGCCLVLVDGKPTTSCTTIAKSVVTQKIQTIEGLTPQQNGDSQIFSLVQQAFLDEQASQCGWCLPALVVNTTALLKQTSNPTNEQINEAMDRVYCRCGVYDRIRKAMHKAVQLDSEH